jgi:hypothetical protein
MLQIVGQSDGVEEFGEQNLGPIGPRMEKLRFFITNLSIRWNWCVLFDRFEFL